MRKITDSEKENFKIEDDIFVFGIEYSKIIKLFITKKIETELNKSFNSINKKDIPQISELILKLKTTEILYSIMGLLEYYPLSTENKISKIIEKLLKNTVFAKYRDLISNIVDTPDTDSKSEVEKFEQENNITVLYE